MIRTRSLGMLVWLAVALVLPAVAGQQARHVIGTAHLRVLYWPEDEDLAELAARAGDEALVRLKGMLEVEPPRRVDVYIVRSQQEFNELVGFADKPWVLGRAWPEQLRVVVKPMGPQRLPGLLAHELAHVMLEAALGDAAWRLPRWLHEGIAKYAADDFSEDDRRIIAQAAVAGELLSLDDLEDAFAGSREQVALAYAQSYTLVAYLSSLEPAKGIRPLLEQLAKGRDVRQALGLAFGKPVPEMEAEWLQSLQDISLRSVAPPLPETIIGALFVLSFIVAVVMVRRRSARIRRRMEEEERLKKLLAGPRWEPVYPHVPYADAQRATHETRGRGERDEEFFVQ